MAGTATQTNTVEWPGPNGKLMETHHLRFDAGTTITVKPKISTLEAFYLGEVAASPAGTVGVPSLNATVQGGTTQGNYSVSIGTAGLVFNTIGTTSSQYFATLIGY